MRRFALFLTALLLMAAAPAWGNPADYPEYAKAAAPDPAAVRYMRVEELARHLLDSRPVTLVDVRQPLDYAMGHITGAVSIPLGSFYRGRDLVPKEGLVVLY